MLRANNYKLHGILNGIDMESLTPMTDPALFVNYGPKKPKGKLENKLKLLELCGLEGDENVPVIGMVSRFADHKGFDLLEAVLDDLLQDDVRLGSSVNDAYQECA